MLTAAMDGPPGEIQVDVELVEVLLAQQHPNLATLPLRASERGFDNFMFRLGESFAVRMPRFARSPSVVHWRMVYGATWWRRSIACSDAAQARAASISGATAPSSAPSFQSAMHSPDS